MDFTGNTSKSLFSVSRNIPNTFLDLTLSTEYPNLTLIDFVQVIITNKLYTKQFNLFEP